MVTRSDYPRNEVEACLSVLVEFMTLLGEFKGSIVLVGGWVPYFLIEERKQEHIGSLGIDAALDFKSFSSETYSANMRTNRVAYPNLLRMKGSEDLFHYFFTTRAPEIGHGLCEKKNLDNVL